MKSVAKLLADLLAWRWAPAAGLLAASMLFVVVVVGIVPSEIGEPVANTKVASRSLGSTSSTFGADTGSDTTPASFGNSSPNAEEPAPAPAPPPPVARIPAAEFGRRGFSPPLERPDPPPAAVPPPPAPVIPVPPNAQSGRPISGIFSRLQGALRPGSPIAAAAAAASANAANAAAPGGNAAAPAGNAAAPAGNAAPPATEAPAASAEQPAAPGNAPAAPGNAPAEGTPAPPTREQPGTAPPGAPPAEP